VRRPWADGSQCDEKAEGVTPPLAREAAKAFGFVELAGGRRACPVEHERGVS
jgi:hypothetical protein